MKKLYQKLNLFEKLGIFAIIITLVVTSIPYLNSNMLNAETDFRASLQLEEDSATKSKKLSVKTQEASFNKVILLLNDKEVSRSSISPDKPAVFYIQSNGTYTIQILDASDKVVETQKQKVGDFTELRIEPVENSATLKIIGRITGCDHFIVTFQDVKQEISITTIDGSSYSGEFTPEFNGIYSIACVDAKGNQLGSAITYEVTNQKDAPTAETPKDEPKNQNEIHINNETELKNIDKDPSKTYVLDRDIIITDTTSSTIVTKQFTGTLNGKGYQIKGLSQPLFASVKNARIENLALQGAWENKEGAMLAVQSDHSTYFGIAINADLSSEDNVAGMILTGDQDQIEKSYVSGSLVGKQVSGFVLNGKTTITSSYVSGLLSAKEEAYGFSKEADITNSHLIATVSAEKIHLFNQNEAKLENCYYDINLQELEEERAEALTTQQILALDLSKNEIYQSEKNSYPSIKGLKWSEEAKKSEALSRIALSLTENIHGITENINLPTKVNDVDMEWSSEGNLELSKNVLKANVSDDMNKDTSGILKMKSSYGVLAYDAGSASQLETSPVVGESLAEPTTHISFNAIEKHYYFIEKQGVTVKKPTTHKEAIDQGWKRYLWNGIINWSSLDWYTDYVLYDLAGFSSDNSQLSTYEIKTKQGLVGGTVTLSDGTAVGSQIIATLSDDALIKKGSWTWERSKSLAASTWEAIPGKASVDTDQLKSTYTPVSDDASYYLRATFQVSNDLNYTGSVTGITSTVVKEALIEVKIFKGASEVTANDMVVNNLLKAEVTPNKFGSDVIYEWYHADDNTRQAVGQEYLLTGKDVGKTIYVKAVPRGDGGASNEVTSTTTAVVQKAKLSIPTYSINLISETDTSLTVNLPDASSGLYQFAYLEANTDNWIEWTVNARANNSTTIRGLKANKYYTIRYRQIGENGYENSDWINDNIIGEFKTEFPHIKGTIEIDGSMVFGNQLTSHLKQGETGQKYTTTWYIIDDNDPTYLRQLTSGEEAPINDPEAIGRRLKVVYKGQTSNQWAGEVSAQTEIIKKATVDPPGKKFSPLQMLSTAYTIQLTTPAQDAQDGALSMEEKFIIGYSLTENGVPIEYSEDSNVKIFEPNTEYTLTGFQRNTTYYFFLRYAETNVHYKSDWQPISSSTKIATKKDPVTGSVKFTYESITGKPIQGDKLTAYLDGVNATSGSWNWTRIDPDTKVEETINNYYPDGNGKTYIIVPTDETPGTTYKVEFVPEEGYSGTLIETSEPVQKFVLSPYPTPTVSPVVSEIKDPTDTTLTFKMPDTADDGAVYEFKYGTTSNIDDSSNVTVNTRAYKKTDVTITGLDRNQQYYIWVRQVGDDVKSDSEWNLTPLTMSTIQTDIHGYVTISETPVANETLTATYTPASYIPTGDDTVDGTWKWYRENGSNWDLIAGATSATYTPTAQDINKKLKAVFNGNGDFKDSKEAISDVTKKALTTDPKINSFQQIADDANGFLNVEAKLDTGDNIWYRLQALGSAAPSLPSGYTDDAMKKEKWTKATSANLSLIIDYDGKPLTPDTSYILYIMHAETGTNQPSNIISANTDVGQLTQRGKIIYSGKEVVTQKIKATLATNNNTYGTWKWYISTKSYLDGQTTAPSISDANAWKQLSGGYYPSVNSGESELTLNEEMFAHYVRAEFVANENLSYKGTITGASSSYVKKIYDETLTLSSSTKDGNGDPKAYAGTVITGTINNYIDSDNLNITRDIVKFSIDTPTVTPITPEDYSFNVSDSTATFTYTLPEKSEYDGKTISAEVSKPKNYILYVDKSLNPITSTSLNSIDTRSNIGYKYGIPIDDKNDLVAFLKNDSSYNGGIYSGGNRSSKFVITNHINMEGAAITYKDISEAGLFKGSLDGQFHTVANSPVAFFIDTQGTAENPVVIENLIIRNSTAKYDSSVNIRNDYKCSSALVVYNSGYLKLSKIMVSDSVLEGYFDGGGILGKSQLRSEIDQCASSGSQIIGYDTVKRVLGGLVGYFYDTQSSLLTNNFSINSTVSSPNSPYGRSWMGGLSGGSGYRNGTLVANNNYSSALIANLKTAGGVNGNMLGTPTDDADTNNNSKFDLRNTYYDKTISPGDLLEANKNIGGIPLTTNQMIGTNSDLAKAFGNDGTWVYKDGYYPVLSWLKDHPVTNMYAATRGAFTSVDNQTSDTDMFNGKINGPIKVPTELQKSTYSYESSDSAVLKVTDGGTIIPVGNPGDSAVITIKYTEPDESIGGTASNKYTFTIGKNVSSLTSLEVTGKTNPGETLTAAVNPSSGVSYQWYRRPQGTSDRKPISGATGSTYTIKPSDVGMEINVDVTANGYPTSSNYTAPITSVAPTTVRADESNVTDNSVVAKADGIAGTNFEYAYSTVEGGKKMIVGQSTEPFTISGLARNTSYWLYARVAGADDGSYEASAWSNAQEITTKKTDIMGPIVLSDDINTDLTLKANISDTNMQTGSWKLERVNPDNSLTPLTPTSQETYNLTYTLKKEDVGSKIRVSYVASGNFKNPDDGEVKAETATILKKIQAAPTQAPTAITDQHTDSSLSIKEDLVEAGTSYEFGYREKLTDDISILEGTASAGEVKTISGLNRNTTYYVYARKTEKEDYEPSVWSVSVQMTTQKTDISSSTISSSGQTKVDETVTFTLNSHDSTTADQTGLWKLERIKDGGTNTLIPTIDGNTATYKIVPEDSGSQLKATFIGTGDYKSEVETTTTTVENASQTIGSIIPTIVSTSEYSVKVRINDASNDIFEFGYQELGSDSNPVGDIIAYPITVAWGNDLDINPQDNPLKRDTKYNIYVRKAEKVGYNHSEWSSAVWDQTQKSVLKGNVKLVSGTTAIGSTLKVTYEKGNYPDNADDTGGTWEWYLGEDLIEGVTGPEYTVAAIEDNPEISVIYTAKENSGFTNSVSRNFGAVRKDPYEVPAAATVTPKPADNSKIGSELTIVNSEIDNVFIYLRDSSNSKLPDLLKASDITNTELSSVPEKNIERWIPAKETMDVLVPANRTYVVFSARLTSTTNEASGITSTRGSTSAKEPLVRVPVEDGVIKESDTSVPWKALQEKTLEYGLYGKAPTASWKYYVKENETAKWQNIDSELSALGRKDMVSEDQSKLLSTITLPLKYTAYQMKVELTGIDDYEQTVTYTVSNIEGKLIDTGGSEIIKSETTQIFDTLKAKYESVKDKAQGYFTWYRETGDNTNIYEAVKTDTINTESYYQTSVDDYKKRVYAVYTAAPDSEYSGTAETDKVLISEKATQNTPDPVGIKQINGNSIQVIPPSNYKTENMDRIPDVVLGYIKCDESGEPISTNITWQINDKIGETWFKNLEKNTNYRFYAQFNGTEGFKMSEVSSASEVAKTENALFNESDLKITLEKSDTTKVATENEAIIGDTMHVSFTGDGYDEGYFSLSRSNGQNINDNVTDAVTIPATKTISFDYVYTYEDVGSNIIVSYTAKSDATHFDGTISKSNGVIVNKPMPTEKPEIPVLKEGLDTNLLVELKDGYEYYLSENATAPDATSGDWDILEPNREDKPNYHDFRNLKRTTKYYLHARIAETKETMASASVTSEGVSPEPFIDMGNLTVLNMKDNDKIAMSATTEIEFPYTLNKANLTITNMTLTRKDGTETANPDNSVDIFKDADGNATRAVIEKGSTWADSNFAFDIKLYGVDGTVVSSTNGDKKTLVATNAKTMNLEVYRANAIAKGGTYVWQALVKDNEDHEALLQSEVIFSTDMKQVMPIKMEMNLIADTYLKQTSNTLRITNDGKMPVTVGVDKKTRKGTNGVPNLKGIYSGQETSSGEAYLKISNDNSNYTSRWNGVWLDTTLTDPSVWILAGLGDKASTSCYATGIADPTQSWPWPVDGKVIEQAYGIKFVTEISKEDIMMGTQEKKVFKEE